MRLASRLSAARQPASGLPNPVRTASGLGSGTRQLAWASLAGLVLAVGTAAAARAQSPSPNQPLAIQGQPPQPCPLLVPKADYALQPLRIQPSQVAAKNAMGCLSPADAEVYGADGCPVKLCRAPQGTVPLPQL